MKRTLVRKRQGMSRVREGGVMTEAETRLIWEGSSRGWEGKQQTIFYILQKLWSGAHTCL